MRCLSRAGLTPFPGSAVPLYALPTNSRFGARDETLIVAIADSKPRSAGSVANTPAAFPRPRLRYAAILPSELRYDKPRAGRFPLVALIERLRRSCRAKDLRKTVSGQHQPSSLEPVVDNCSACRFNKLEFARGDHLVLSGPCALRMPAPPAGGVVCRDRHRVLGKELDRYDRRSLRAAMVIRPPADERILP